MRIRPSSFFLLHVHHHFWQVAGCDLTVKVGIKDFNFKPQHSYYLDFTQIPPMANFFETCIMYHSGLAGTVSNMVSKKVSGHLEKNVFISNPNILGTIWFRVRIHPAQLFDQMQYITFLRQVAGTVSEGPSQKGFWRVFNFWPQLHLRIHLIFWLPAVWGRV